MYQATKWFLVINLVVLVFGMSSSPARGESPERSPLALQVQPPQSTLTLDEVVRLVQAGVSEEVIIARIRQNNTPFSLTGDQIVQLKKSFVTDSIIRFLLDPRADLRPTAPAQAPPPTVVPQPAPAPVVQPAAPTQPIAQAAQPFRPQDAADERFWRQQLQSAKSKRSSGLAMALVGLGLDAAAIYPAATMYEEYEYSYIDPFTGDFLYAYVKARNNTKFYSAIGLLGAGAVLSIWGGLRRSAGTRELHSLEAEGRSRGYISVAPSPRGKGVMVAYNW